jgi:hypothetical protein
MATFSKFMNILEYESMQLDPDLEYIQFRNVRLLPQPSLFTPGFWASLGLCGTVWDSALFFFGRPGPDNLVLFLSNGTTERLTVQRPTVTRRGPPSPTKAAAQEDPIENVD